MYTKINSAIVAGGIVLGGLTLLVSNDAYAKPAMGLEQQVTVSPLPQPLSVNAAKEFIELSGKYNQGGNVYQKVYEIKDEGRIHLPSASMVILEVPRVIYTASMGIALMGQENVFKFSVDDLNVPQTTIVGYKSLRHTYKIKEGEIIEYELSDFKDGGDVAGSIPITQYNDLKKISKEERNKIEHGFNQAYKIFTDFLKKDVPLISK